MRKVNKSNPEIEVANYTLVSTETLQNEFPDSASSTLKTVYTESDLSRVGFFQALGRASRRISEPAAKRSETLE